MIAYKPASSEGGTPLTTDVNNSIVDFLPPVAVPRSVSSPWCGRRQPDLNLLTVHRAITIGPSNDLNVLCERSIAIAVTTSLTHFGVPQTAANLEPQAV